MKATEQRPAIAAAIHDLSCFGRCALTVILPTLSALGVQAVPLPTALLSSHTGGFDDLYFRDLFDSMAPIAEHFERLKLKFDAVYSGFLGSDGQIDMVERFIKRFRDRDTLVLVDPVMGDDGVRYSTYTDELVEGMKRLCRGADVITPNHTEACFLTDIPYLDTENMSEPEFFAHCEHLLLALRGYESKCIAVTGLHHGKNVVTVGQRRDEAVFFCMTPRLSVSYPGTGDIFASVLLGEMLRGCDFAAAVRRASEFTAYTIEQTIPLGTPVRNGVALEACMDELVKHGEETNKRERPF